VTTIADAHD